MQYADNEKPSKTNKTFLAQIIDIIIHIAMPLTHGQLQATIMKQLDMLLKPFCPT